ncbi:MAG: ornithine cyclodeaminase/alanine dehydrogenase-like protein (mu-crystallin family) [Pseudohongiellaceae bacterium]|jgi:ornithine cyclodeaminase/alanine dehydrogenase-like protein (mu-crystallin family)
MTATMRYLSDADVRGLMPPMTEVLDVIEEALGHHGNGQTQMPAKIDLAPGGDNFLHAMPAYVEPMGAMGMKWVAGYPGNREKGLPYIQGSVLLNDPDTGRPLAMLDAAHITAVRTAACTAVTAKHLADPNAEVFTIIGCGVQGRANIEALLAAFPKAERMLAYDNNVERQADFADEVMVSFDLASVIPPEPQEACEGGHIIVTSLPIVHEPSPVIEPEWIQTGTLCVPLDFDASFTPAAFERADLFVTDDKAQFDRYRSNGHFKGVPDPSAELGAVVAGKGPNRPEGTPIVMAANLGLGILDVTLAALLLKRAEAKNVGTTLSL